MIHIVALFSEEKCCGESMNLICPKCDCELCNENTERRSEKVEDFNNGLGINSLKC